MSTFERGENALDELIRESSRDLNEATTRRRLIDVLLSEVLGWPQDQIRCEEHIQGDYLDYTLGEPLLLAVLEAKRTSLTFEVPAGMNSGLINIQTLYGHSKNNQSAIDQVLGYCQKAGAAIAVLSNGYQYVAFLGSRTDGKRPLDGRAYYYASLEDIRANYHQFWDFLSHDGVNRGDLRRVLSVSAVLTPPPQPLSSRINAYPGYRIGSEMETDLRILGDLFIQDVVREESVTDEFLQQCYCSSGALSQYSAVSKEILRTRYMALDHQVKTESARGRKGPNESLTNDVVASALTRRPIVLLGDVGVGKSIFLKHLFRVEARELLDKTVVFYVDFLEHSGLFEDVPEHLVVSIASTLLDVHSIDMNDRDFVRSVYNREINAFKRGIYGALEETDAKEHQRRELEMLAQHMAKEYEHARRSLESLQNSRGYNFVIVLDNVDQHQASFQEQIFVAGQSLAQTWPVAVFISLRPDTFHESRRSGALAAYQPRVFTVSPPRSDQVVVKRLDFAKAELIKVGRLPGFPRDLTLDSESLIVYIDVLIDAFRNNEQLVELMDNLSSGNTRRALDFISTFVGSGYVQTSRILDAHKTGRPYVVPLHEFERAILYGDHKHYDPETSPVPNLLSLSTSDKKEHFLLPLLLAYSQSYGEGEAGGFAEMKRVFSQLQALHFSPEQIEFHVSRAVEANLLEVADSAGHREIVRVTPAGAYLQSKMISRFPYFDAVVVDTPIMDPNVRGDIREVWDIVDRVDRAERFASYLDSCWPFAAEDLAFSWPQARRGLDFSIAEVQRGVKRAAERRRR